VSAAIGREPIHQRKDAAVPFADINMGEALLLALEIFFFVVWIWILITILTDLFRDHELSGWGKAAWVLFLVFIPFLTALIYLIARGSGMRDRTIKAQAEAKQHMDAYIREQAHVSPADELHKLNELKEKGALSAEEFERAKAKLLA
jgi:Phospholipase_D-nuclease N-terminal/Short C-terminal domain